MNRLVFLGTAGDAQAVARQQRSSGGLVLTLNDNQFHLDPGPGSLANAKAAGVHPRETVAILATNNHIFRSNDINAAISAMTYDGMDTHGVLLGSKSVVDGHEMDAARLLPWYREHVEGVVTMTPTAKVAINDITVLPVKSYGNDQTGVGVKLQTDGLTVGYTGDTGWYQSMPQDYAGCNVLIVNCRHDSKTKEEGHLNLDDAGKLIQEVKPKAAFLTGFGTKLLQGDLTDAARQIQRATNVLVTAAKDSMSIDLQPYARRS